MTGTASKDTTHRPRMFNIHGLGCTFIAVVVIIVAVTMGGSAYLNYQSQKSELVRQLLTRGQMLGKFVALVSPDAVLGYDFLLLSTYVQEIGSREDFVYAAILSPTNKEMAGYFNPTITTSPVKGEDSVLARMAHAKNSRDLVQLTFPIVADTQSLGILYIGLTTANINQLTRQMLYRNLGQAVGAIIVLCFAIFLVFRRKALVPIYSLIDSAKQVAAGNFTQKTPVLSNDELGLLATQFNAMTDALHQSYERLNEKNDQLVTATKAKSAFLANMSHEIRTPLTAIIGFGESLLDDGAGEVERLSAVNTIIRNGNHLLKIINDILDISKIEADKLEVDLVETSTFELIGDVKDLISLKAREKQLAFNVNYQYPIPSTITTDPLRLKQILINLCGNAIKFTERGRVNLDVSYDSQKALLCISIADSGIGLSQDQIQRIFTPFTQADASTTRRFGGTGLGLALSSQLAAMLGGSISVESKLGVGSCFSVTIGTGIVEDRWLSHALPQNPRAVKPLPHVVRLNELKGRVLLAEDTADNQRLIKLYLSKTGIDLTIVDDGDLAVRSVAENSYDLVLMDMEMPTLHGMDAVKEIRTAGYQGPILALTANDSPSDRESYLRNGCNGMIAKPIERELLYSVLRKFLGGLAVTRVVSPVQNLVAAKAPVFVNPVDPRQLGGKILLAEDTPDNQLLVNMYVQKTGATMVTVENGKQAVELALTEAFDLILMDMQMPVMGGLEAVEQLRAKGCSVPIVALTANALTHDKESYFAAGCAEFIPKPIDRALFYATLARFLPSPAATPAKSSLPNLPMSASAANSPARLKKSAMADDSQGDTHSIHPDHEWLELQKQNLHEFKSIIAQLSEVMSRPVIKGFMRQITDGSMASNQPIYSQLANDDPDMREAVDRFIDQLVESKSTLNKAFQDRQWEVALQQIHNVKGSGGAFGYPQLSTVARDIDKLLRQRLYQESSLLLCDLNDIYDRIIAGRLNAG